VTIVNRENFFLFTPMLHEIAASESKVTAMQPNEIWRTFRSRAFRVGRTNHERDSGVDRGRIAESNCRSCAMRKRARPNQS